MFDGESFGLQMVEIVRGYMAAELEPLRAENKTLLDRIDALERRELLLPEKGEPGEVDMAEVASLVETAVKSAVGALPARKDGEPGKDGIGLADALIDREGGLVLTMTDGTTKNLGPVVGKDGDPGKDGHTFTLDDFEIVPMDERTIKMGFTYGEVMHSFELALPALIYRNVWKEGESYDRGDLVTWGGSMWHCDKDGTTSKPDGGDWTLSVKRGRDGRDAPK